VLPDNIAYVIFTSGSTGTPKPAQLRHKNFKQSIQSLLHIDLFNKTHTVVQMARCSFDLHVQEILGTLVIGATIIMLHPQGNFDFEYLSMLIERKQITFLYTVPTLLQLFFSFIKDTKKAYVMEYLRSLCTGGERCSVQLVELLESIITNDCSIWNLCGPAETTLQSLFHRVNSEEDRATIPLGRPLPNYSCIVKDDFGQPLFAGQEGEILVRGVGIFAGYLDRDDLTAKALVEIDDELFYRTGDLVRLDNNGLLHYQGRKDHQIKLHGQRIELGEIEQCLLRTSVSACVVIKGSDDHLIAYVQSSDVDEKQLRQHCQCQLAPHMVPSFFIILEKLPLNANGKVDRKSLPIPETSLQSSDTIHHQYVEPSNELEIYIHSLWCQILDHSRISIDTNFFGIGGHSLLLIQLYQNYKITLNVDTTKINISKLFQYTTIADHARLIHQSIDDPETYEKLLSAVNNKQETSTRKRACSISRENIILVTDELSRYEPFPVTDIQLAYLVGREGVFDLGHVSAFAYYEYDFSSTFDIECFERALNRLIRRHEALRLIFPSHTEQKILKTVPYYTVSILNLDGVESPQKQLIERREQLSHQILPADQWPLFDFQITRFTSDDGFKLRLHYGIDILILDVWSQNLVFYELNQLYYNSNDNFVELKLSYRDYILAQQHWKHTTIYSDDRQYWINRLQSFPLGPNLPLQYLPNEI
ncbi:unnamed protein product, partial [Adineta steineri]